MDKPEKIQEDVVVSLDYELTVDGELIDSSVEDGPILFIQGRGQIIPGLESELYEMKIGEEKSVNVAPKDGYGEIDPEAIQEVPKKEFPENIPLEVGVELEMKDENGDQLFARIVDETKYTVILDFNEALAGKDLHFKVKVADLRPATVEEMEHGHVHEEGHSH